RAERSGAGLPQIERPLRRAVRVALERVIRFADRQLASRRRSGPALLDDVRELVSEETIAGGGPRRVRAGAEHDVAPDGVRDRGASAGGLTSRKPRAVRGARAGGSSSRAGSGRAKRRRAGARARPDDEAARSRPSFDFAAEARPPISERLAERSRAPREATGA